MDRKIADKKIVDLIQNSQKEQAFELIVSTYTEPIYWNIRRIVATHEDADDLLQEVFIKVWRKLEQFKAKSTFYTWIYRISTNEALGFLRKRKKKRMVDVEGSDINLEQRLKADPHFIGDEAQLQLTLAINELPEKQKSVFLLRYYEEMSYSEISTVLNTSSGALRSSYHHAVKKIEEFLLENVVQ